MRTVAASSSDDDASQSMPSGASPSAISERSGRRSASPSASGSGIGAGNAWGGRWNSTSVELGTVSKPRKHGVPPHCVAGIGTGSVRSVSGTPSVEAIANVPAISPAAIATVAGVPSLAAAAGSTTSGAAIANGAPNSARPAIVAGPGAQGSASIRVSCTTSANGAPGFPSMATSRSCPRPANRPAGRVSSALADKSRVLRRGVLESSSAGSAANSLLRKLRCRRPLSPNRSSGRKAAMPCALKSNVETWDRSRGLGQWQPFQLRASSSRTAGVRSQTPS